MWKSSTFKETGMQNLQIYIDLNVFWFGLLFFFSTFCIYLYLQNYGFVPGLTFFYIGLRFYLIFIVRFVLLFCIFLLRVVRVLSAAVSV